MFAREASADPLIHGYGLRGVRTVPRRHPHVECQLGLVAKWTDSVTLLGPNALRVDVSESDVSF